MMINSFFPKSIYLALHKMKIMMMAATNIFSTKYYGQYDPRLKFPIYLSHLELCHILL